MRTPLACAVLALVPLATGCAVRTNPVAEDGRRVVSFGGEVQAYPAGVIAGAHVRHAIDDASAAHVRLAANVTDRGDFGEHDDETGSGFGFGTGYRRALNGGLDEEGWLWGVRADLWFLDIAWEDPGPREGSSDIVVLQPTVEFGYGWTTESAGRVELVLGVGAEINVDTSGEDVGEGAIGLLGLTWLP